MVRADHARTKPPLSSATLCGWHLLCTVVQTHSIGSLSVEAYPKINIDHLFYFVKGSLRMACSSLAARHASAPRCDDARDPVSCCAAPAVELCAERVPDVYNNPLIANRRWWRV